jgi:hypothetical protein
MQRFPWREFLLCALALTPSIATCATGGKTERQVDIVVVGAGTGGASAAIQAARMGATVDLIDETDWIGGQMTAAGVATMDEGTKLTGPQGIYSDFTRRIGQHYASLGKSVGTCYYTDLSHCYEPHVAQQILYDLIDEANGNSAPKRLQVHLRTSIARVLSQGMKVVGVVTKSGETIHSGIVIDATEYGDLLPLSPAIYRAGSNVSNLKQHDACVQSITYLAIVKKYPLGVPPQLVMRHAPPGYDTGQFRSDLKRHLQPNGNPTDMTLPVSWAAHNVYRGMPDTSEPGTYSASQPSAITKTALNWFNDFAIDTSFFDRQKRHQIVCRAKLKTLQFLYYVQQELGEKEWSVANDEGYDTAYNREENSCQEIPAEYKAIEHNLPQAPYVRESLRVVGEFTLTSLDNRREGNPAISKKHFEDAVALGDYGNDLHGCSKESDLEAEFEHEGDRVGDRGLGTGAFQIPLAALIPKNVDGLLVAEKNISQSRFANGATRLQPVTMVIGQAVGALAALSSKRGVAPRNIPARQVQIALLQANSSLALGSFIDGPTGTDAWRAAQFAVVHGWLALKPDGSFGYNDILTRGEAAEALASMLQLSRGYASWRGNQLLKSSFIDVPLYDRFSGPVESLHAQQLIHGCSTIDKGNLFCPGLPATENDLASAILAFSSANGTKQLSAEDLESLQRWQNDSPLSRTVAAQLLYWWGAGHGNDIRHLASSEGD